MEFHHQRWEQADVQEWKKFECQDDTDYRLIKIIKTFISTLRWDYFVEE